MQSLLTLTVRSFSVGMMHLVLRYFILQSEPPMQGLPQLTQTRVVSIVTVTYYDFGICQLYYSSYTISLLHRSAFAVAH